MKDETMIKNGWCEHFKLTPITHSKYYKIVGCFILGVELIKIPNRGLIHPHLTVYPLWKENVKQCYKTPYQLYGLKNKNNLQEQLTVQELLNRQEEVFDEFEEYVGFDITNDVTAMNMYNLMNKCQPYELNDPWRLMVVSESNVYQAVFMNDKNAFLMGTMAMNDVFARIQPHLKLVESIYGDFEKWKEFLHSLFEKRDNILELVKKNSIESKVKQHIMLI